MVYFFKIYFCYHYQFIYLYNLYVGGAGVREARRGVREGRPAGGRVQEGRRVRAQLWRQLSREALRVISSFISVGTKNRSNYFGVTHLINWISDLFNRDRTE